jgi:hypothetical protein
MRRIWRRGSEARVSWSGGLARILSRPPQVTARNLANRTRQEWRRWRDHAASSYRRAPAGDLAAYFERPAVEGLRPLAEPIAALGELHLAHRFDLLGSGWSEVRHGMRCAGLGGHAYDPGPSVEADPDGLWLVERINARNRARSREIWRAVDPGYRPIDWHLDFKSGHRWREDRWHREIAYGHLPGVDVKVPWELSRMQHLPQLAHAHALADAGEAGFRPAADYAREFRNQVLDFAAANPPRFGVNWRCTMDVAIRAANWLVAYDLFRSAGAPLDDAFAAVFRGSIYDHGRFIVENLEWNPTLVANHYLADVAGLLFVAAYLPDSAETDAWLAFAVQEFLAQVEGQFHPDGSNFEASTSYHRLSAEMALYGTALLMALGEEKRGALARYDARRHGGPPPLTEGPIPLHPIPGAEGVSPLPASHFERLERAAEFSLHLTKPNGRMPQLGDNDSGRFLKLRPIVRARTAAAARARYAHLEGGTDLAADAVFWDEDQLDHRSLVAAINGLFGREDFAAHVGDADLETQLVAAIVGERRVASYRGSRGAGGAEAVRIGRDEDWERWGDAASRAAGHRRLLNSFPLPASAAPELALFGYPDFGVYVFKRGALYLAVRCGSTGQRGNGGHGHNDQLAIELSIDGTDWLTDPGTYLYTPLPELRNAYRSIRAHFAPQIEGGEPTELGAGLFRLEGDPQIECLYFGARGFVGRYRVRGCQVHRRVELLDRGIQVTDWVSESTASASGIPRLRPPEELPNLSVSPGYGLLLRELRARSKDAVKIAG